MMQRVHLAGWQKIAWALDEDLRWARTALEGRVVFSDLPRARIVLAAWWPAVEAIGEAALRGKTVVCFADNPPAFYLTRPGFAKVANRVDLWVARSREAVHQFQTLGLPVEQAPYGVDPEIFKPLADAASIRRELDIPPDAFVLGNFHRDSEGADLTRPKVQKGADIFLEIARGLHRRLPRALVLLAGPRRHWLVRNLESGGIPFRFAGEKPGADDDYERNILDRPALNRLYQAMDVCVVSSRWEGGPYSVPEALLAGRALISTPVGIARDLLPAGALFRSPESAVDLLAGHAAAGSLDESARLGREAVLKSNSLAALRTRIQAIFQTLPDGAPAIGESLRSAGSLVLARLRKPAWRTARYSVQEARSGMNGALTRSTFFEAESPDRSALLASAAGIQHALAS